MLRQGIIFKDFDTHGVLDIYSINDHNKKDSVLAPDVIVAHRAAQDIQTHSNSLVDFISVE